MRRKYIPLITGLLLLLGAHVSLALTLSDVRTAIRRNVRDTASSSRYSDAAILAVINEAQRAVINDTWASSDDTTTTVVGGTVYYSLPTEAIRVWRVTLNSVNLPQIDLEQFDADNDNASWSTTGTPTTYFYDRTNPTQIGLQPYPSSSGATLKIFYYQNVPDLASDSDVPFDSDPRLASYQDLITYFATARILATEHRLDEAQIYQGMYSSGANIMNANVGHKPIRPVAPVKEQKP